MNLSSLPLSETFKETVAIRAFAALKVPLLYAVGPVVEQVSTDRLVLRIPLKRKTKNHLGSMYFGALCIGAEAAAGAIAMRTIQKEGAKVALIFKDFSAKFLKRAEGDVTFTCDEGRELRALVHAAISSGERVERKVKVVARVPCKTGEEPVAEFEVTISLKKSGGSRAKA
jgi:acyl-coenzyme A thioesterase PaaI-like protein